MLLFFIEVDFYVKTVLLLECYGIRSRKFTVVYSYLSNNVGITKFDVGLSQPQKC